MKVIKLTNGGEAFVDDEDYEYLSQWKWFAVKDKGKNNTYARANTHKVNGRWKKQRMHRMIMKVTDPKKLVDHKDLDGLNNQKLNLRVCTQSQNSCNSRKRINTSSIYKGLTRQNGKWTVRLGLYGKIIHLGMSADEKEAAKIYNTAAMEYFGEFAQLNSI